MSWKNPGQKTQKTQPERPASHNKKALVKPRRGLSINPRKASKRCSARERKNSSALVKTCQGNYSSASARGKDSKYSSALVNEQSTTHYVRYNTQYYTPGKAMHIISTSTTTNTTTTTISCTTSTTASYTTYYALSIKIVIAT